MSRTTVSTMVGELMGRGLIATLDEEPEALSTAAPETGCFQVTDRAREAGLASAQLRLGARIGARIGAPPFGRTTGLSQQALGDATLVLSETPDLAAALNRMAGKGRAV